MAFDATLWGRRVQLTGLTPVATATGFVALITEENIPSEAMDQGANSALNGGGDLRVSLDNAGTSQLPLEVVTFVTSTTPASRQAKLYVRFPSYESASRSLWLVYNRSGQIQPAVTDTYGRNNVWQDYEYMFHLESSGLLTDSTGNYSLTENGTIVSVAAVVGEGTNSSNSVNNYLTVNGYVGPTGSQARTHKAYVRYDGDLGGHLDYGLAGVDGQEVRGRILNSRLYTYVGSTYARTATSGYGGGNWHSFTQVFDGTSTFPACYKNFVDGVDVGHTNNGSVTFNTVADGNINFQNRSPLRAAVGQDEQSLRLFAISEDLDNLEFTNQTQTNTFWTTGTPEDTGGGGSLSIDLPLIPSGLVLNNPTVTQDKLITLEHLSSTVTVDNPTVTQDKLVELSHVGSTSVSHAPTVTKAAPKEIDLNVIDSTSTVEQPSVSKGDKYVYPETIDSTSSVEEPALVQDKLIQLDTIDHTNVFHTLTVLKDKLIELGEIDTTVSIHSPQVNGGYRPLDLPPLVRAEGYGIHIRSIEQLYPLIQELEARIKSLEGG